MRHAGLAGLAGLVMLVACRDHAPEVGTYVHRAHGRSPQALDPSLELVAWLPIDAKLASAGTTIVEHQESGHAHDAAWITRWLTEQRTKSFTAPVPIADGFRIHTEHDVIDPTRLFYRQLGEHAVSCQIAEADPAAAACAALWSEGDQLAVPFALAATLGTYVGVVEGLPRVGVLVERVDAHTPGTIEQTTGSNAGLTVYEQAPLPDGGFEVLYDPAFRRGPEYFAVRRTTIGRFELVCTGDATTLAEARNDLELCRSIAAPWPAG